MDGFILAATSGEGMSLGMSELERLVAIARAEISASRRYIPICLGLSGASTHKMLRCAGRDRGLADRRLSDREPLLHAAVAARAAAALHRARRPRILAARALQHPLSHLGRHRQRHDAAACRASEHRRPEGLLRQPRAVDRPAAAAACRLPRADRRGRAISQRAASTAPTARSCSPPMSRPKRSPRCGRCCGKATRTARKRSGTRSPS